MSMRKYRPLYGLLALCMAMIGGTALFLGQTNAASTAPGPSVIEVNEQGFNPAVCSIGRSDSVVWKNVGTKVHRIIKPDAGVGSPPIYDSGDIQPGETSLSPLIPGAGGRFNYEDFYDSSLKGVIQTPQESNTGTINCSALPPTPTATPTTNPTATPSPTPTPIVVANCRAQALGAPNPYGRCAVAVELAKE